MNAKELGTMPAHPIVLDGETARNERIHPVISGGMTKREAFAMAAVQGLCATGNFMSMSGVAKDAFVIADAMLAESAKDRP